MTQLDEHSVLRAGMRRIADSAEGSWHLEQRILEAASAASNARPRRTAGWLPVAAAVAAVPLIAVGISLLAQLGDGGDPARGDRDADAASVHQDPSDGATATPELPVPPIARDWRQLDAVDCASVPALTAEATLVRVPEAGAECIAHARSDGVVLFQARHVDLTREERLSPGPGGAEVFMVLGAMSSLQARIVEGPGDSEFLLVRGAGAAGPSVDEIVAGLG